MNAKSVLVKFPRLLLQFAATLAFVATITWIIDFAIPVSPATAGFVYLIVILLIATKWGLLASVLASVSSALTFTFYFLPPFGKLSIEEPHNWVALFAFLITSLVASQLSENSRRRTTEALRRQKELEHLQSVGRTLLLTDADKSFGSQIVTALRSIYEASVAAIYDVSERKLYLDGTADEMSLQKMIDAILHTGEAPTEETQRRIALIQIGGQPTGVMILEGVTISDEALQALSNLLAVGIERIRAVEASARAEASRESQEFKSTLLDALAHELQTPLTSIRGAATAIRSGKVAGAAQQSELIAIIDEESARLTALMRDAIHLARIEAGTVRLSRQRQSAVELVEEVLREMEVVLEGRIVKINADRDLPSLNVDPVVMRLALKQLIGNAAKYSYPNTPIRIRVELEGDFIAIGVGNDGAEIPDQEREKIFDRYYRGAAVRGKVPGSGMGLPIACQIVQAHGGNIRLDSRIHQSAESSTEFLITLPVAAKETLK